MKTSIKPKDLIEFLGMCAFCVIWALVLTALFAGCARWPGQDQYEHNKPAGQTQVAPGWEEN